MSRERLSGIEQAWLRMEDPSRPMMITVLLIFEAPLDFEQMQGVLRDRLLRYPRFRQRVVQAGGEAGPAAWEDDPGFHLDHHLARISLSVPGDEGALRAVVAELMSEQFDLSRPLWQFHLVVPYGEGCAVIGRVHHCLADGPALMRVLLSLADLAAPEAALPDTPQPVGGAAADLTELMVQHGLDVLSNPFRLRRLVRRGAGRRAAMRKLLFRAPDPETILRGRLGSSKQVAWARPMALAEVKAIGRTVGGTVNDVMLAAAAGALRRYLESHGERVEGLTLRAGLSVDLREPEGAAWPGNRAGAVLVELPVGLDSPLERLEQVKRRMDAIKGSPEARVVRALMHAMGRAPAEVQDALVETYCTRETAVIANVAGPEDTIYVAGAPLSTLMFWVPALGGAGLCLSIASYGGQVWFGVSTDRGLVPDPEGIVAGFQAEFDALRRATRGADEASEEASVEAMRAKLDQIGATLDALLEETKRRRPV